MIVFLNENYLSKVDGKKQGLLSKEGEFHYGFKELARERILVVVFDESMKETSRWGKSIPFNLGSVLFVDMSETSSSEDLMVDLY